VTRPPASSRGAAQHRRQRGAPRGRRARDTTTTRTTSYPMRRCPAAARTRRPSRRPSSSMWAEMAAPLIIGSDPRALPPSMIDVLKNPEILAVDQDPLSRQGVKRSLDRRRHRVQQGPVGQRPRSVVLLNRGDTAQSMTVDFASVRLAATSGARPLGPAGPRRRTRHVVHRDRARPRHRDAAAVRHRRGGRHRLGGRATATRRWSASTTRTRSRSPGADGSLGAPRRRATAGPASASGSSASRRRTARPAARIDVFVRGTDNAVWRTLRERPLGPVDQPRRAGRRGADGRVHQPRRRGRSSPAAPTASVTPDTAGGLDQRRRAARLADLRPPERGRGRRGRAHVAVRVRPTRSGTRHAAGASGRTGPVWAGRSAQPDAARHRAAGSTCSRWPRTTASGSATTSTAPGAAGSRAASSPRTLPRRGSARRPATAASAWIAVTGIDGHVHLETEL
jgi:hypothetical protein